MKILDMQTGPARRNDLVTIQHHMELLSETKALAQLYSFLFKSNKSMRILGEFGFGSIKVTVFIYNEKVFNQIWRETSLKSYLNTEMEAA